MKFRKDVPKLLLRHIASIPFIYAMLLPFIVLDIFLELYHRICFALYKLPYVQRSDYIRIDRHKLSYLRWFEKINCLYCGYANGLLHYAGVIAGKTEEYWCGIKHKKGDHFVAPQHHKDFLPYNDREAFDSFVKKEQ